jgi:hypothetical protein
MANVDSPRGLLPVKPEGKSVRTKKYIFAANEAAFKGDLLILTAGGEADLYDNGDGKCLGVAAESVAAAATEILVYDDPDQLYQAQCDGTFALADIGSNVDVTATAGADGQSKHEIESASFATTSTLPIKILDLSPATGNAVGTNAVVICKLNNSVLGGDGSTGI